MAYQLLYICRYIPGQVVRKKDNAIHRKDSAIHRIVIFSTHLEMLEKLESYRYRTHN